MILYRGTPEPEAIPRPREYAAVFFAPTVELAAEYGEFVQKYKVGRQRILNFGTPAARRLVFGFTGHRPARDHHDELELDLFWHPTAKWVRFVLKAGYSATAFGGDIAVFDLSGLRLLDRYRVSFEKSGRVRAESAPQ